MEWSEEAIARLRLFWTEGLSTAEIGRRMGISKNAVVGKAHRLLLSPRPSPIRREPDGNRPAKPVARRLSGPTLPSFAMPAAAPPREAAAEVASPARRPEAAADLVPRAARPLSLAPRPLANERRRNLACCWPIGEPGTRSFRFCDDASLTGKPYCAAHAALAYVKVRDRRDDAA